MIFYFSVKIIVCSCLIITFFLRQKIAVFYQLYLLTVINLIDATYLFWSNNTSQVLNNTTCCFISWKAWIFRDLSHSCCLLFLAAIYSTTTTTTATVKLSNYNNPTTILSAKRPGTVYCTTTTMSTGLATEKFSYNLSA